MTADREAAIRELCDRITAIDKDAPPDVIQGYKNAAWDAFLIVEAELAAARTFAQEQSARISELRRDLDNARERERTLREEAASWKRMAREYELALAERGLL